LFTVGKAVLLFTSAVETFNYFKSQFQKKNLKYCGELGIAVLLQPDLKESAHKIPP
jgi:hypothetical protein